MKPAILLYSPLTTSRNSAPRRASILSSSLIPAPPPPPPPLSRSLAINTSRRFTPDLHPSRPGLPPRSLDETRRLFSSSQSRLLPFLGRPDLALVVVVVARACASCFCRRRRGAGKAAPFRGHNPQHAPRDPIPSSSWKKLPPR